jgi:hypothetical protein
MDAREVNYILKNFFLNKSMTFSFHSSEINTISNHISKKKIFLYSLIN